MGDFVDFYLTPTKKEEMVRLVDYVTEATRKHSLELLGEDITIKDYDYFDPYGFKVLETFFHWRDHTSNKKHLDIDALENDIATHFPDMEFTREMVINNNTLYHAIGCNGKWEKLKEPMDLYVFFDNEEQLNLIASNRDTFASIDGFDEDVTDNKTECFVKFGFGNLPETKFKNALEAIIATIGQLLPGSELPCIMTKWYDQGDSFSEKATIKDGKAEWQEITSDEYVNQLQPIVERDEEYYEIIMKRDYINVLFK